jgi:GNAT superfamily N-acetyltransferase
VTSRGDVHWVVTEYGAADLWGKTVRERAAALIEVAHPDFRTELVAQAKARKYVLPDQRVAQVPPRGEEPFVAELRSGPITIRPIRVSDEDALQDLFYKLSEDSSYQRFHAHVLPPGHEKMLGLVDLDHDRSVSVVAIHWGDAGEELIGMARYDVTLATGLAEVSLVVVDAWQSRGVGTVMFRRIAEVARARGVAGFHADVLSSNGRMLAIFNKSGLQVGSVLDQGSYRVDMTFPQPSLDKRETRPTL